MVKGEKPIELRSLGVLSGLTLGLHAKGRLPRRALSMIEVACHGEFRVQSRLAV